MRGSTFIKRFVALLLVVLMSIDAFAAIVGDNDGAAFITKAEFDSMKNDFQTQLDRYNSSIDNKIDGAIASYLAGITITKKRDLPILCSNYQQMRWANDLYLYGKKRVWTDRTTYTTSSDWEWFKPVLDQKRVSFLDQSIRFYDNMGGGWGNVSTNLWCKIVNRGPGVTNAGTNWGAYGSHVLALCMEEDDEGWYVVFNPLEHMLHLSSWKSLPPHSRYSCSPAIYDFTRQEVNITDVVTYTPASSDLWDVEFRLSSPYWTVANQHLRSVISTADAQWPVQYNPCRINQIAYGTWTGTFKELCPESGWHNDYLHYGPVTSHLMNTTYYVPLNITYQRLMLGSDNDTTVNLAKNKKFLYGETYFDVEDSTETTWVDCEISIARIMCFASATNPVVGEFRPSSPIMMRLSVPFLPQEKLRNLSTHYFKVKNKSLKHGEGLPLLQDADSKGYVQLKLKYNVKDILTDHDQTKKIYVDIKNKNFLDDSGHFIDGWTSTVDPDHTSTTQVTLNRVVSNDSSGNLELTVPVEKGDDVWIRITPYDTNMDRYASITDIKGQYIVY